MPKPWKRKPAGTEPTDKSAPASGPLDPAAALAEAREVERTRRRLHAGLRFPRICTLKICKRAHACAGDVNACAARHFPLLSQKTTVWLQRTLEGMAAGLPYAEAERAARAHVEGVEAALKRLDQRIAQARGAAPSVAEKPAPAARNGQATSDSAPPPRPPPPALRPLASVFARRTGIGRYPPGRG
jgi:hypothetical protein